MRAKRIRGAMKTLFRLDERIGRSKWRKAEPSRRELTRDELIQRLAVAGSKVGGSSPCRAMSNRSRIWRFCWIGSD